MEPGSAGLGERIKPLRRRERPTLTKLSERSGIAISTLSKIENGQTMGAIDTISKIARRGLSNSLTADTSINLARMKNGQE